MVVAVRVPVVVRLIDVEMDVGQGFQQPFDPFVRHARPVDVERLELRHAVQRVESRVGDGDVDQVQEPQAGQASDRLHTRIGDLRRTESQQFQAIQPREFALLEYLMRHPGRAVPKTVIQQHVWDFDFDPQTNVVEVLVHRLRQKVDHGFEPKLIHTIRGVGYALRVP